jgi:hypothetical protein
VKKGISRLIFSLTVLLLVATPWTPAAQADLSCGDCFSLCLLSNCGFVQTLECQQIYWSPCAQECQPPNCG